MSWQIAGRYVRAAATDPDAQGYLQAVEAADGQALEFEVARAIDNFVLGCKQDGIWDAIKASCILAGARTLAGALVPLVGAAPTNFNFVSGDYNRKTGLVGDGSTKYLGSNRNNTADPQDNKHHSAFVSKLSSINGSVYTAAGTGGVSGQSGITHFDNSTIFRVNSGTGTFRGKAVGFLGCSRQQSSSFLTLISGSLLAHTVTSQAPLNEDIGIFARVTASSHSNARLAFYSIGESLDLALLDARVTDLINAFDTAIPS
jgi:hypothetical protein